MTCLLCGPFCLGQCHFVPQIYGLKISGVDTTAARELKRAQTGDLAIDRLPRPKVPLHDAAVFRAAELARLARLKLLLRLPLRLRDPLLVRAYRSLLARGAAREGQGGQGLREP